MMMLSYVLAFWLLYKGVLFVWISLRLKLYGIKGWGWILAAGIGTLIFTTLISVNPVLGGLSIVFSTALAFLGVGDVQFFGSISSGAAPEENQESIIFRRGMTIIMFLARIDTYFCS